MCIRDRYYNTTVDTKAFAEVPGMEITNIIATLNAEKDQSETIKAIEAMEPVSYTHLLPSAACSLSSAFQSRLHIGSQTT